MTTTAELRECPFCGSVDVRIHNHGNMGRGLHHGETVYTIGCFECGAQLPGMYSDHGRAKLIEKWNTRPKGGEAVDDNHEVTVEVIGYAKEGEDGPYIEWLPEGGIHDLPAGLPIFAIEGHLDMDDGWTSLYTHPPRSVDEAKDAVYRNLLAASKTYFIRYCVDEADEDPQWTGCSEQQSIDARELRDAIDAAMAEAAEGGV